VAAPRTITTLNGPPALGALGFSFMKALKQAGKFVSNPKNAWKILAAPIVAPVALTAKATTHVLSKTGVKPLVKLNTAVDRVYKSSDVRDMRDVMGVGVGAAAAVVGAIYAAPAVLTAAGSVASAGGSVLAAQAIPTALSTAGSLAAKAAGVTAGGGEAAPVDVGTNLAQQAAVAAAAKTQNQTTAPASAPGASLWELAKSPIGMVLVGGIGLSLLTLVLTKTVPVPGLAAAPPPRRHRRHARRRGRR
jgi:hypothetical protein